jgi:hypothetical protein
MGSTKRNDSNRTKVRRRATRRGAVHARPKTPANNVPPVKPDIDEVMGRLSDAISVVATAANALLGAQEREGSTAGAEVGDEITTLLHGVRCIRRAYDALDVAVRTVQPERPRGGRP